MFVRPVLPLFLLIALASTVEAQFTPTVQTTFTRLDAGASSGFTQDFLFLEGQEGPADLTLTLDRGSYDFSGIATGDVVGSLTLEIFVDLPFPLPDVSGEILGEIEVQSISSSVMTGEAIVTFIDPAVLIFLIGAGFPDPSGQAVFAVTYTDFGFDLGVELEAIDLGILPTAGVATIDVPLVSETTPILVHSPGGGTLLATTVITSQSGFVTSTVETFDLVGGVVDPGFLRGDASGDLALGLDDAVQLLAFQFSGGPAPGCEKAADVDDNGSHGLPDAIVLLNFLFVAGSPPPPPPGPACGIDPTPDPLPCDLPSC